MPLDKVWLVYDYLLTLRQEVDFIWRKPFSGLSLMFYVNRYGALALRVLVVAQVTPDTGPLSQEYADRVRNLAFLIDRVVTDMSGSCEYRG